VIFCPSGCYCRQAAARYHHPSRHPRPPEPGQRGSRCAPSSSGGSYPNLPRPSSLCARIYSRNQSPRSPKYPGCDSRCGSPTRRPTGGARSCRGNPLKQPQSRAAALIGYPPTQSHVFDVEATVEGQYEVAQVAFRGLAFAAAAPGAPETR
jgi:hypothetical protein